MVELGSILHAIIIWLESWVTRESVSWDVSLRYHRKRKRGLLRLLSLLHNCFDHTTLLHTISYLFRLLTKRVHASKRFLGFHCRHWSPNRNLFATWYLLRCFQGLIWLLALLGRWLTSFSFLWDNLLYTFLFAFNHRRGTEKRHTHYEEVVIFRVFW